MCSDRTFDSVTSLQPQIPHGTPGGSGSHGHSEVNRLHIGQYSMHKRWKSQEACFDSHGRLVTFPIYLPLTVAPMHDDLPSRGQRKCQLQ